MKRHLFSAKILCALLLQGVAARTGIQSPANSLMHFDQDGLSFDYASGWEFNDQNTSDAQRAVLGNKEIDAQIIIISPRQKMTSKEQLAAIQHSFIEPSIESIAKQYESAGLSIERSELQTEVSGTKAEGVRFKFTLDGQPGSTDICWLVLNQRFVLLIFTRPDKTAEKANAAWDVIRQSLKVEKAASSKARSKR